MYKRLVLLIVLILSVSIFLSCNNFDDLSKDISRESFKLKAEGQSEHWKTSLIYTIEENNNVWVDGTVTYTGENLPKEVNRKFVLYDIEPTSFYDGNVDRTSITIEVKNEELINSEILISETSTQSSKNHELEVYQEAINYGFIELKWNSPDGRKIEKIGIQIVE